MNSSAPRPTLLGFFRHVWKHRSELDTPQVRPEEAEFLPGTLALEAAPPSPTATWVSRLILLLLAAAAAWCWFGQVDIVIQAPSVIVTAQRNQVLASPVTTQVQALHVQEGSRVLAGDILMSLDATAVTHEGADARQVALQSSREAAVGEALLHALQASGRADAIDLQPAWPAGLDAEGRARAQAAWAEYRARVARLQAELEPARRALRTALSEAAEIHRLHEEQLVSRQAWTDREQQQTELEARVASLGAQMRQVDAEFGRASQDMVDRGRSSLSRAQLAGAKALSLSATYQLRAPVDGTVHRLAVHTVGGVVGAAQPLLEIVPDGVPIELEATVPSKDIAHVAVGQAVSVKVDAFDPSQYGVLNGRIAYISPDALREERAGETRAVGFRVRVTIDPGARPFAVSPGMTARADIRTGSRRLAAYLLSPIARNLRDSFTER